MKSPNIKKSFEFVDELAKLQDRVPAFSPKKARDFIKAELGAPVEILFREFEDQPIAAASLGQVHRDIVHNREKVVVKACRPTSIPPNTRDGLYNGLPISVKTALRSRLQAFDAKEENTLTTLGEMFQAARSIMSWLGDCAKV